MTPPPNLKSWPQGHGAPEMQPFPATKKLKKPSKYEKYKVRSPTEFLKLYDPPPPLLKSYMTPTKFEKLAAGTRRARDAAIPSYLEPPEVVPELPLELIDECVA